MSKQEKEKEYRFTTKTWLYLFGLLGLLGFIAISAVWDLTFGYFDAVDFVADTLILIAIAIGSFVLAELFSEESNMNKLHGVYNTACSEYVDAMSKVEAIIVYFSQWYFWFLVQETRKKREGYLILHGIEGTAAHKIVAFAELSDIARMKNCSEVCIKQLDDGRKIVLPKLETEEQAQAVESVLKGEQDVKGTNYSDYLFIDDIEEANMSVLERKDYLNKRMAAGKRRGKAFLILRIVATSLLMAALVPANEEEATASKWWLFAKRVGVFLTSALYGWITGSNTVVAKAAIVRDKVNVIGAFRDCHEKKLWAPKTQEELDAEIIERYEQRQRESLDNLIDPEPQTQAVPLLQGGSR